MSVKAWHIDEDWQEPFVEALRGRGASPHAIDTALAYVEDRLAGSGESAQQEFGDPGEYAATVNLVEEDEAARRASQGRAIALAVAGLVGMFLALWGFTGLVREVDKVAGMPPLLPLILGIVVVLAAAVADLLLGRAADVYGVEVGRSRAEGPLALVANRLAPWIIVALTAIGMVLIQLRHG